MLRHLLFTLSILTTALTLSLPWNPSIIQSSPQNLSTLLLIPNATVSSPVIWPDLPYDYPLGWGLEVNITHCKSQWPGARGTIAIIDAIHHINGRLKATVVPPSGFDHYRDKQGPVVFEYRTVRTISKILESLWDNTIRWGPATVSAQIVTGGDFVLGNFYLLLSGAGGDIVGIE